MDLVRRAQDPGGPGREARTQPPEVLRQVLLARSPEVRHPGGRRHRPLLPLQVEVQHQVTGPGRQDRRRHRPHPVLEVEARVVQPRAGGGEDHLPPVGVLVAVERPVLPLRVRRQLHQGAADPEPLVRPLRQPLVEGRHPGLRQRRRGTVEGQEVLVVDEGGVVEAGTGERPGDQDREQQAHPADAAGPAERAAGRRTPDGPPDEAVGDPEEDHRQRHHQVAGEDQGVGDAVRLHDRQRRDVGRHQGQGVEAELPVAAQEDDQAPRRGEPEEDDRRRTRRPRQQRRATEEGAPADLRGPPLAAQSLRQALPPGDQEEGEPDGQGESDDDQRRPPGPVLLPRPRIARIRASPAKPRGEATKTAASRCDQTASAPRSA